MAVTTWADRRTDRFEIRIDDPEYPQQLTCTPDPPSVLYGVGDPSSLRPGLAIVGARKATPYGASTAEYFAGWSAGAGYCVISGAAIGCDQSAHLGALKHGGTTVAVLGCGADVTYPAGAGRLLNSIAASGAVVSELPWGHPPLRWAFLKRNRIIAGLSAALLVVEARLPSGTFSTAEFALDAGRDVLAIPGSIFAPESRGTNRLLRHGATPITDVSDLAMELERLIGPATTHPCVEPGSQDHDPLLSALVANPMRPDDVAFALGVDVVTVVRRIGALESARLVERYPDGRYGRSRDWGGGVKAEPRYNAD